jgi:hypothetical protein
MRIAILIMAILIVLGTSCAEDFMKKQHHVALTTQLGDEA